jgi:uncharacterized protein YuzE
VESYPQIREDDRSLIVEFAPDVNRSEERRLRMIVDLSPLGKVVGVEIINAVLKAGKNGLKLIEQSVPADGNGVKYSYDADSDSFYLRLTGDRSVDQKAVDGFVLLDDRGRILALGAEWL